MGICKWELLEEIPGLEVNARIVAEWFGISMGAAQNRLKRAYDSGWLNRRKVEGAYYYSLSEKAWDFHYKYGSFINQPYYGYDPSKKLPEIVDLVSSP